jgi:cellulose synthase operon protein C
MCGQKQVNTVPIADSGDFGIGAIASRRKRPRPIVAVRRAIGAALLTVLIASVLVACAQEAPEERLERAAQLYADQQYSVAAVELRNVIRDRPENLQARLLFAQTSIILGDLETAEIELLRARDMGAASEDYAMSLAYVLARRGRPDQAALELDRIPADARGADWYIASAEAYSVQRQFGAAELALNQALEIEPDSYAAMLGMTRVLALGGNPGAAYEWVDRAILRHPDLAEGFFLRANLNIQTSNLAAAERDLLAGLSTLSAMPTTAAEVAAYLLLGRLQIVLNRREAIEDTARRARSRAPGSMVAHFLTGAAHHLHERYEQAQAELQNAASQEPDNQDVSLLLGANHLARNNLGQAEQVFQAVLAQSPANVQAARLLAEVRRRQGRSRTALEGLRLSPMASGQPVLLAYRGLLHMDLGEYEAAVELLERASEAVPGDSAVTLQLARAYIGSGRADDATGLFADLRNFSGGDADGALELAVSLLAEASTDGELQTDEGRDRANRLLSERPDDPDRLAGVGVFRFTIGDRREGLSLLERATIADPGFMGARLLLAALTAAAGESQTARAHYEEVTALWPDSYHGWLGLAVLAAADQALDEARLLATRAVDVAPDAVRPQVFLARIAFTQGDIVAAQAALDAGLRLDPDSADTQTLAGALASSQQRHDTAIQHLTRAADIQPNRADRWLNLGRAQRSAGDLAAARNAFERAATLTPRSASVRLALAELDLAAGDPASAARRARDLQVDYPSSAESYLLEARALFAVGEHRAAVSVFDRAWELQPSREAAMGSARARRSAAVLQPTQLLERWLERTPDDVTAWLMLAQEHQLDGDDPEALQAYDRVLALQSENIVALNNAAWLYNQQQDPRALDYARRAVEAAPEMAPVLDTLGWVLVSQGRADSALPYLREAAERAPQSPDIRYHLAYALARTGDAGRARAILNQLIESEPDEFSYLEQARSLLDEL